jgi:putative membrane protein
MKRCVTFFALAILVGLFAGCGERAGLPQTETTGTSNAPMETATASATTTASTGGTVSNLPPADKEFVSRAGMGGLYEVQAANLALERAASPDVQAFAQQMLTDHSQLNHELQELATVKGLALPAELSGSHKAAIDHLRTLSGAEFDRAYMQHTVSDHDHEVAEFERASRSATDQDLRDWAARTLPTLKSHAALAMEVAART